MPQAARCLRCGKEPASAGWQCATCAASFADWDEREWDAALDGLEEDRRWLANAADRLDGAGFWAVAKAVWAAEAKLMRLARAIEDQRGADDA